MGESISEIYLHLVWATWRRQPLVTPAIERAVHRCISDQAQKLRCTVLAVGGMPDHIHLAVIMPTTVTVARIANQIKGVSSTLVRNRLCPEEFFNWQDGYAVFSFGPDHKDRVISYIRNQKKRHAAGKLWPRWEETAEDDESPP
jgi:REP element-mobilizing transposase RayT